MEELSKTIFNWFQNKGMKENPDNGIKANPDKCHILLSKNGSFVGNIGENKMSSTKTEKLLGLNFDNRLPFNNHISNLCKGARLMSFYHTSMIQELLNKDDSVTVHQKISKHLLPWCVSPKSILWQS